MKITNIKNYIPGANNVTAVDMIEAEQFPFNFTVGGGIDLTGYTFDVDTQLIKATVTETGSDIEITAWEPQKKADGTLIVKQLTNAIKLVETTVDGQAVKLSANLEVKENLLSELVTQNSTIDQHTPGDATNPYIVDMSVTLIWPTPGTGELQRKRGFRLLFVQRSRPFAS